MNRVITWCPWGLQYEADPRHVEVLVRELEVQPKEHVVTPGVKWKVEDIEGAVPLDEEKTARFRALAARANYLAMDRMDISFASKECCRRMVRPGDIDWQALRRLARYLGHKPRVVYRFEWQPLSHLTAYVDTDFAGCLETRRSTSGGCLMHIPTRLNTGQLLRR